MHQKRNPTSVSQLLAQIPDLQNRVNSLSDAREFHDPESASSSGPTHVPDQTSTILSPRTLPRCDSGLPHDARNETFLNDHLLWKDDPLQFSTTQKELALHSQELRPDTAGTTRRREWNEKRTGSFTSHTKWRWHVGSHWWNLFSQWYDGLSENSSYGMESWKFSWLHGISKLESHVQNWGLS